MKKYGNEILSTIVRMRNCSFAVLTKTTEALIGNSNVEYIIEIFYISSTANSNIVTMTSYERYKTER